MNSAHPTPDVRLRGPVWFRTLIRLIPSTSLIISSFFILKTLAAPYAWNGDLLNVLQLSHWFALFVASALAVRQSRRPDPPSANVFFIIVLAGTFFIGADAYAFVIARDATSYPKLEREIPVIAWVNTHVPTTESVCTDHGGDTYNLDDLIAAHTGRVVHFAHTTLYHKERDVAFLDRMRSIAAYYDVRGAGDADYWQLQSSLNQFIVCEQYPFQVKLFKALGMSQTQIDSLIGCPRQTIDARWQYVVDAIEHPVRNDADFKSLCPYVIIPDTKKAFWHLPSGYQETRVSNHTSIFSIASSTVR